MPRVLLSLIFAGSALYLGAQQPADPPLPPPAIVAACLPNLWALEPSTRPDIGEASHWNGGRATVRMTVDLDGNAELKLISTTDPVVATDALRYLKTWKFAKHQPGRIEVIFEIKLAGSPVYGAGNAKVEIGFPNRVTITVSPSQPFVVRVRPQQK